MALTKASFKKDLTREVPEPIRIEFELATSWDDGGINDMRIADILTKYSLPGVFYIIVDRVGEEGYLTWANIKELDQRGFEIGSHTMSHPADLKELYEEDLFYEVVNSKDMIETVLGHHISKFCYPRGRVDERVKEMVRRAGYTEARVTGKPGVREVKNKLEMPGTIHIFQRPEYENLSVLDFAKGTIDTAKLEGGYINIWGHSKEIDTNGLWDVLDQVLDYAKKAKL
jgi:peptidoglycan/xylan/chitin deacetylase (PgdA/CDA1 family)